MPSLFNVIKNNSVISKGSKEISTEYEIVNRKEQGIEGNKKELGKKNAKNFIENYEVLARTMVENARKQSDSIVASAYNEVQRIQEEAYNKAYEEGKQQGYSDGREEADEYYKSIKNKANDEIEELNRKADELLYSAKNQYLKYLQEKQREIQELIIHITESVLKSEVKNKDAITSMILDALEVAKDSKNIIVKCNNKYLDNLKENIEEWKVQAVFRGEIFIIPDDSLEDGKAIIQKENGKIVVDIVKAIEKIEEIILQE